MEEENKFMRMGSHLSEIFSRIIEQAMGFTIMKMEINTKASGKMIYTMDLENKYQKMEQFMKAFGTEMRKMEKEF